MKRFVVDSITQTKNENGEPVSLYRVRGLMEIPSSVTTQNIVVIGDSKKFRPNTTTKLNLGEYRTANISPGALVLEEISC